MNRTDYSNRAYSTMRESLAAGDLDVADAVADYLHYDRSDLLAAILVAGITGDYHLAGQHAFTAVTAALTALSNKEAQQAHDAGDLVEREGG